MEGVGREKMWVYLYFVLDQVPCVSLHSLTSLARHPAITKMVMTVSLKRQTSVGPSICITRSRTDIKPLPWTPQGAHRSCYSSLVMVDTPVATASAACWLLNSQGNFSWPLQAGQQVLCHCLGGNYCSYVVCQQTGGERQAAWAGYKCPCPYTSPPSAGAECKRWSSSCQLLSSCSSPSAAWVQEHVNTPLSSLCPMEATGASGGFGNFAATAMLMDLPWR